MTEKKNPETIQNGGAAGMNIVFFCTKKLFTSKLTLFMKKTF